MTTEHCKWMGHSEAYMAGLCDCALAEHARFLPIAERAERLAIDAARDPGMYPDPAEGFRWAAEAIRQAVKECQ